MYIVNDKIPSSCMRCPFGTKCPVWDTIFKEMNEEQFMDFPIPTPMQYTCCKIVTPFSSKIGNFYLKWIRGFCRHLCVICRHKKECDLHDS